MSKVISCGIAPIRKNGNAIEILLGQPIQGGFYGVGFLKGQVENGETNLEAAKREFSEESGNLDVEIINENIFFEQNNPKKKIFIWPAKVLDTENNRHKITKDGIVNGHDEENEIVEFYNINNLPVVFRNQQDILDELLIFINKNKDLI